MTERKAAGEIIMLENIDGIETALKSLFGENCRIDGKKSISGGDINRAYLLELNNGNTVFLKQNTASLKMMFAAEADGLFALSGVSAVCDSPPVPRPLGWGIDGNQAFLLMEEVRPGRLHSGPAFGRALAELHRNGRSSTCGFDSDNWIGSTTQCNKRCSSWFEFFADCRLSFQWTLARKSGFGDSTTDKSMDRILGRLQDLLPNVDSGAAHLLHGDLWGGNWMAGSDGRGWLIDPAVYYGHREADLAMTELFGGFPAGFRRGYLETWPLEAGFDDRKELYNLYHLLNHVNIFGGSYWPSVVSVLKRYS